jgi:hypothetical protein
MARAGQPLFVGIGRRQSQDDGSLPRAAAPFMTASPLRLPLLLLAALILAGSPVAMASPPPVPPPLTAELERLYASWKTAMSSRDLAAWSRTTARARQMMVRNTIVSQKRDWPRSLFALAMTPPEIRGLRLSGSQLLGAEARLVYHGRIDFQIDDPRRPPDAVLVLDFVQEAVGWRFFASRYFNFRDYPAESAAVARGDLGFLNAGPFALTGTAPPVPRACPVPDYAAQIRVASFGYTTRVRLGDHHQDVVTGRATTEVVQGGLRRGVTPLRLEVEPLADVPAADRSLEVIVHVLTPNLRTKSSTVFTYQPNNPAAPRHDLSVIVGPSTLHKGNEGQLIPAGQ